MIILAQHRTILKMEEQHFIVGAVIKTFLTEFTSLLEKSLNFFHFCENSFWNQVWATAARKRSFSILAAN